MKKYILGAILSLGLLVSPVFVSPVEAAGLTSQQISSIIGLLQAFGADQSVINRVSITLNHGSFTPSPYPYGCSSYSGYSSTTGNACNGTWTTPTQISVPTISYINPTSATVGDTVYVYGLFGSNPYIQFDGKKVESTKVANDKISETVLSFAIPSYANTGTHYVQVIGTVGTPSVTLAGPSVTMDVTASATATAPTVTFLGTPTLSLQYDSAGKETNLVSSATVRVTTGNSSIDSYAIAASVMLSKNGGFVDSNSKRFNPIPQSGVYKIPANSSATYTITETVPARELFAGTYTLALATFTYLENGNVNNAQYIQPSSFIGVTAVNSTGVSVINGVNPVTIVGEVSPYISSVVSDLAGNATIKGVRLTGGSINYNGITKLYPLTNSGVSDYINFKPSDFGVTGSLTAQVQIINSLVGNSNIVWLNYTAPNSAVALPTLSMYANGVAITNGQTVSLTSGTVPLQWGSNGATSCTLNGVSVPTSGSKTLTGVTSSSQSYVCTNSAGPTTLAFTVTVSATTVALPTLSMYANGVAITNGQTVSLTSSTVPLQWGSNGATSCTLNGVSVPTSGSKTLTGVTTSSQSYVCTNSAGSTTLAFTVTVPATIGLSISGTTLSWTSSANASSCQYNVNNGSWMNLSPLSGSLSLQGIGFSVGTTYTLNAHCLSSSSSTYGPTSTVRYTPTVVMNSTSNNSRNQLASALEALNSATNAGPSESLGSGDTSTFHHVWNNNLQIGSSYSADVTALQTALTKEGVYTGDISGGFYSQTFNAVKAFQQKYGIDTGTSGAGFVGSKTREKLNSLY